MTNWSLQAPVTWVSVLFWSGHLRCHHFVSSLAENELAMHEIHGHSPAPVYKIDFGLLTLKCYRWALQHLDMPPSVSTLGWTGFESWQNVFNWYCVWTQRTRGLLTKTLLEVQGRWQYVRGCSDNESNPGSLHTPTNCFQLINGAEVRSRCVCVCVRRE